MNAKTVDMRGHGAEAVALRLCRELYRLDAGRILRWRSAWTIQQSLAVSREEASEAWRYAEAHRWVETSHGDGIGQVTMLEAGRRLFAEENHPPAEKPKRRARR